MHNFSNLTVKPLSDTRWESIIDAVKPISYQLGNVDDAVMKIYEDNTESRSSGNSSRLDEGTLAEFQKFQVC